MRIPCVSQVTCVATTVTVPSALERISSRVLKRYSNARREAIKKKRLHKNRRPRREGISLRKTHLSAQQPERDEPMGGATRVPWRLSIVPTAVGIIHAAKMKADCCPPDSPSLVQKPPPVSKNEGELFQPPERPPPRVSRLRLNHSTVG
jgi:hypothetical protein